MEERKGVKDRIRDEGLKLGMKAVSKLMEDPDRAQMVMGAVQKVQQGKESLDDVTGRLRNLADLPSRDDFKELGKLVGKLRREVRKLKSQLDDVAEKL
ncbi:MAG: hypothetical protein AB2A00_30860 [Myxococcota bacterium]